MDRLIYLFELDSVCNTPQQIHRGQQALFYELVHEGNRVVLSMNQLTDSLAFLVAVRDPVSYQHIMRLFHEGALKISRYGSIRTASQYIQQAIERSLSEEGDSFIFTGLPVRNSDKPLLHKIMSALKYSDPSLLEEQVDTQKKIVETAPEAEQKAMQAELERIDFIYRYIKMILRFGVEKTATTPIKTDSQRTLSDFLDVILTAIEPSSVINLPLGILTDALTMLKKIRTEFSANVQLSKEDDELFDDENEEEFSANVRLSKVMNNRSNWVHQLNAQKETSVTHMAQIIVDLCYNYTVEDSISAITKNYSDADFPTSFLEDFKHRLVHGWKEYQALTNGKDEGFRYKLKMPNWAVASRIAVYSNDMKTTQTNDTSKSNRRWRLRIMGHLFRNIWVALFYCVLFCLTNWSLNLLGGMFENWFSNLQWNFITVTVISVVVFGIAGSALSTLFKLPDILKCIQGIVVNICDLFIVVAHSRKDIV